VTASPDAGRADDEPLAALGAREAHVWCVATEAWDDRAIEIALATLSPDERARAGRFRFARDRCDYIAAHDLLRRSLSRYAAVRPEAWTFRAEPNGRPRLCAGLEASVPDPPLAFSLSHTHGFVACAVARGGDIGVDVERASRVPPIDEIGRIVLSAGEIERLRAGGGAGRAAGAIELWTLKEAYAKATGEGLSAPLTAVCFDVSEDGPMVFTAPDPDRSADWRFALVAPVPDVRLAVAVGSRDRHAWRLAVRFAGTLDVLPVLSWTSGWTFPAV
jgi:4'-phosphopantetheinyl transferase